MLLSLPSVQTWLAGKAMVYLKENLNIEASIGRLAISFPNRVEITDLYLADDHSDTLLFAHKLFFAYSGFDGDQNTLLSSGVRLLDGRFYLRKYEEDSLFNFGYFLEKLSTGESDTTAEPFRLKIASIEIAGMNFEKHRLGCMDTCTNIFISDAQLRSHDFFLDGDDVYAQIDHFSFTDTTRFSLHDLKGNVAVMADTIRVHDFLIKTDRSEIAGSVSLISTVPDSYSDFLNLVKIEGYFLPSTFSSNEFISYIPEFPQFDEFSLQGKFNGVVNDFSASETLIRVGEKTAFSGKVRLRNTTETEFIRIEVDAKKATTSPKDFKKYITQFAGEMEWMQYMEVFDIIKFQGSYKGGIDDFLIKGDLEADENKLTLDLQMSDFDDDNQATYKGKVISEKLNLRKILNDATFGYTAFNAHISGKGLTDQTLDIQLDAKVSYADILDYRYQNLNISGKVEEGLFDGFANLKDPNIGLEFIGSINYLADTIVADFKADVTEANLKALGFSNRPVSMLNFSTSIDYQIFGKEMWEGEINFTDITYNSSEAFYFFDTVRIVSTLEGETHRDRLYSRLLTAELMGKYNIFEVGSAFNAEYLNFNRLAMSRIDRPKIDFDFSLHLNNTEILSNLFLPELKIEPGTTIEGFYQGLDQGFYLTLKSELISWKKQRFNRVKLIAGHDDSLFSIDAKVGSLNFNRQFLDSLTLVTRLIKDSVWFETSGIYRDSIDSYFRMNGYAFDISSPLDQEFILYLENGRFNVGDHYFDLIKDNLIHFRKDDILVNNVGFVSGESSLVVNGFIGTDPNKILRIDMNHFDADVLNYIIRDPAINLKGNINGNVVMIRDSELPNFASDITIDSLHLNDDYLGNLRAYSNWDVVTKKVTLNSTLSRGTLKMLDIRGSYLPDSTGEIDFDLTFNRMRLNWVNPFVEGILENVRGNVSGDVKLTGNFKNIQTNGKLICNQIALGVPFLGTDYGFEGQVEVDVSPNLFKLSDAHVRDTKESTAALLSGSVSHTNYSDFAFNLSVNTDNLLVLDAENSEDAYFYGKGYAEGKVTMVGPIDDLVMNINITTKKGTDFKIPFSNPVSIGSQDFITFTGKNHGKLITVDLEELEDEEYQGVGGLSLFLDINVTPDAAIELVMDETVGDIIRGRGVGNIKMSIPADGDIEMFGTVEVVSGDYLFTMRNLINKKFIVIPGGTLAWNGSPYDAMMKLKARYTTRTTLTGMVTTSDYQGQRVQVDLIMDLDGLVTNPNINFQILLPSSNPSYQEELNNRLSDPDKLNYQAFSLLLINAFWTESVGTESNLIAQGGVSNTMQMATAQFSNWLAQGIGNYIDINIGYNTATDDALSDELEVDISKNFLDDRLTVNSKLDVPLGTTTSSAQNFTGDLELIYKITSDGRIRAKAFNRSNQDNPSLDKLANYTQGVGVFYQTNFNTFSELMYKLFGIRPRNEELSPETNSAIDPDANSGVAPDENTNK